MQALVTSPPIQLWPLAVGVALLVVAAGLNHRLGRIPNQVTFGAIAAAWVAAIACVQMGALPTAGGGIASSVACTAMAFAALIPAYAIGVPAGCVKTQMGFGAWVGCTFAFESAYMITGLATLGGLLLSAACVSVYQLRQAASALPEDGPIDYTRPPELFPLQTTLSLGTIAGLVAMLIVAAGRAAN